MSDELEHNKLNPLALPGFSHIPIDRELAPSARFAHGHEWRQVPAVTAREMAMDAAMNDITDERRWRTLIFKREFIEHWRRKIFRKYRLMSDKAWDWCLQELRDKAKLSQGQQHVQVLDFGPCVCKADASALQTISDKVREAAKPLLQAFRRNESDGGGGSSSTFVDPLMLPLVYGESLVLPSGETKLNGIFDSYEDAETASVHDEKPTDSACLDQLIGPGPLLPRGASPCRGSKPAYRWSYKYQALPFDVKFTQDRYNPANNENVKQGVRITSYVNNIHPLHEVMYRQVEQCISKCIPMWNDCLIRSNSGDQFEGSIRQPGRIPLRILTFGIEWENELPEWLLAFRVPPDLTKQQYVEAKTVVERLGEEDVGTEQQRKERKRAKRRLLVNVPSPDTMKLPPRDSELWNRAKEYLQLPENHSKQLKTLPYNWDEENSVWFAIAEKHERLLRWKHPEPGTSFSYEEWKSGRNTNKPIVAPDKGRALYNVEGHISLRHRYNLDIRDSFREEGLQLLIQMQSIDLEPDTDGFVQEDWDMEGQLNEHIVAGAIFPFDVENIEGPRIEFRQAEVIDEKLYQYHEEERRLGRYWNIDYESAKAMGKSLFMEDQVLEEILGVKKGDLNNIVRHEWGYKNVGSVAATKGRLITFPNVLEHRLQSLKLTDTTKAGHYRMMKLFLVDPNYRICSTSNVPPQQFDWWAREVTLDLVVNGKLVSREIANEIMDYVEGWLMKWPEARRHRTAQLRERRWNAAVRYSAAPGYGFS